jgi:hypothetical protein
MANLYSWGGNPFRDYLLNSMLLDIDISNKQTKRDINSAFKYFLQNILNNPNEAVYLDFEIIKNEGYYKLIGKNAISALWLCGFFPVDATNIMKSCTFIIGNRKYEYNKKTKELTYTIVKN